MLQRLAIIASLFLASAAGATDGLISSPVVDVTAFQIQTMTAAARTLGLNWTVNDYANYNIDMGFIKGTLKSKVREETTDGFWMEQDVDLGFAGKQKIEILLDKNTGEVKKILVNGQPQDLPDPGNMEVEEMTESNVTVPAGTFDVIYVRIKDLDKNETSEAWLNPKIIPMSGMAKQKSPSQFGSVVLELTEFKKH